MPVCSLSRPSRKAISSCSQRLCSRLTPRSRSVGVCQVVTRGASPFAPERLLRVSEAFIRQWRFRPVYRRCAGEAVLPTFRSRGGYLTPATGQADCSLFRTVFPTHRVPVLACLDAALSKQSPPRPGDWLVSAFLRKLHAKTASGTVTFFWRVPRLVPRGRPSAAGLGSGWQTVRKSVFVQPIDTSSAGRSQAKNAFAMNSSLRRAPIGKLPKHASFDAPSTSMKQGCRSR